MNPITAIMNALKPSGGIGAAIPNTSDSGGIGTRVYREQSDRPPELRTKRRPEPAPERFSGEPHRFSDVTARKVFKANKGIVGSNDYETLARLGGEYRPLAAFANSHTSSAAREKHYAQLQEAVSRLSAGEADSVDAQDHWSVADWAEDYAVKREAAVESMRKICAQAEPIVRGIAERLGDAADEMADDMEKKERAECASWGQPFRPSPQLVALGRLSKHLENYLPISGSATVSPDEILRSLGALKD